MSFWFLLFRLGVFAKMYCVVMCGRLYLVPLGSASKKENAYILGGGCASPHQKTAFSVLLALGLGFNFRNYIY